MQLEKQQERLNDLNSKLNYNNEILNELLNKLDYSAGIQEELLTKSVPRPEGLLHDIDNNIYYLESNLKFNQVLIDRLRSYIFKTESPVSYSATTSQSYPETTAKSSERY